MLNLSQLPEGEERPIPVFSYKIVQEATETDNPYIPSNASALTDLLDEFMEESYEPTKRTPERIQKAIAKYPRQPQFYNYLSTAYIQLGKNNKAREVNRKTYDKFPDYLFAKLGMAQIALSEKNFDKVHHYLGESLRLEDLYPERKIFHSTEVLNYYMLVGRYYTDRDDLDSAQEILSLLEHVDDDSRQTENLSNYILAKTLELAQERFSSMSEDVITLPFRDFHYEKQTETPPVFHHSEIQWLYEYDQRIPYSKIETILALPRKTLIEDLEAVLEDGIRRFAYWNDIEWGFKTHSFVDHAIMLLGELRAYESLPGILNQLRQGDEYNEFWFSDWIDDVFQTPMYHLGRERMDVLRDFVLEPRIEAHCKNQASKPLMLMAVLEPERRQEIVAWYEEVIRYFLDHEDQEDLLDTDFLAFLIGDISDAGLDELKPVAKEVYDRDLASLGILGEWEDVDVSFEEKKGVEGFHWYFENASKQYAQIAKAQDQAEKRDREDAERYAQKDKLRELEAFSRSQSYASDEPVHVEKIGRNERVSVKYADGTVKSDVKYKTVEQDVASGKATLMR
ncbi:MAG: DUF1186 domain-containing protein [Bacteroidetes bacterium]|nr:DUF1186 domain-containing protein [Bacteroidota bacterium]